MEKLLCLCSVYDIMFAELKTAIITIISKYSEKENDIPIINNEEINPILIIILIRSKLMYFFSNLHFIKTFGENLLKNKDFSDILSKFEEAAVNLNKVDIKFLKCDNEKMEKRLSMLDAMKLSASVESIDINENKTILDEEKSRVASLIVKSTSETI